MRIRTFFPTLTAIAAALIAPPDLVAQESVDDLLESPRSVGSLSSGEVVVVGARWVGIRSEEQWRYRKIPGDDSMLEREWSHDIIFPTTCGLPSSAAFCAWDPGERTMRILVVEKERLFWIVVPAEHVREIDFDNFKEYDIALAGDRMLWLSTAKGLIAVNKDGDASIDKTVPQAEIFLDRRGEPHLLNTNSIRRRHWGEWRTVIWDHEIETTRDVALFGAFFDERDRLWVLHTCDVAGESTWQLGVSIYRTGSFEIERTWYSDELPGSRGIDDFAYRSGTVAVSLGTENGIVRIAEGGMERHRLPDNPAPASPVPTIRPVMPVVIDGRGTVWCFADLGDAATGADRNMLCFFRNGKLNIAPRPSDRATSVGPIAPDPAGGVWVGLSCGDFFFADGQRFIVHNLGIAAIATDAFFTLILIAVLLGLCLLLWLPFYFWRRRKGRTVQPWNVGDFMTAYTVWFIVSIAFAFLVMHLQTDAKAEIVLPDDNDAIFMAAIPISLFLGAVVLALYPMFLMRYRYREPLSTLGFASLNVRRDVAWGVVVGLGTLCFSAFCGWLIHATGMERSENMVVQILFLSDLESEIMTAQGTPIMLVMLFLSVALVAPIAEEIFFRGYLMELIRRRYGARWAVAGSAVVFGLSHFRAVVPLILIGFVFAKLYAVRRSLLSPIIAHVVMNGLALAAMALFEMS